MLGFFSGIGKAKECHKDRPYNRPHPRDLLVRWWAVYKGCLRVRTEEMESRLWRQRCYKGVKRMCRGRLCDLWQQWKRVAYGNWCRMAKGGMGGTWFYNVGGPQFTNIMYPAHHVFQPMLHLWPHIWMYVHLIAFFAKLLYPWYMTALLPYKNVSSQIPWWNPSTWCVLALLSTVQAAPTLRSRR